jgi:1-phosphatidylinositol-4-phosphate 5-kinase
MMLGRYGESPPTPTQEDDLRAYAQIAPFYLSVGFFSVVLTGIVTLMYMCSPRMQRDHASTVVFIVTVCDLLYSLKFLVSALAWGGGSDDDRDSFHFIPDNCLSAVAFGQFFGMAAISFNACWVYDFVAVLLNPLRNTAGNLRWYHAFSWTMATVTTAIVVARKGHLEGERHTCWLKGDAGISWTFTAPLFLYMVLAVASLFLAAQRLSGGRAATLSLRRAVLLRHAAYVVAFVTLWLFPIIHAFADPNGQSQSLSTLDAIAVSGQAASMALIRLMEPGALATLAAVIRRTRNTLVAACGGSVYLSTNPGPDDDDESPIPLAALFPLCFSRAARNAALASTDNKFSSSGRSDAESPLLQSRSPPHQETAAPPGLLTALLGAPTPAAVSGARASASAGSAAYEAVTIRNPNQTGAAPVLIDMSSDAAATNDEFETPMSASASTPKVPREDGWQNMSSQLRIEMGICMLSALVQSASVTSSGVGTDDRDAAIVTPSSPVGLETSADKSVVVAGPSAPVDRRPLRAILRDSTTANWVFALPGALGVSVERVEVSSICDRAFRALRQQAGISSDDIQRNFEPSLLRDGIMRAQFSDGMSSSFFAKSLDGSCVIKTVRSAELEVLVRLLPAFNRHLRDNPASLLVRFYGAWSMRVPGGSRVLFVLMQNVFPIAGSPPAALSFDIKGSTINRSARTARGGGAGAKGSLQWQDQELRSSLPRGLPVASSKNKSSSVPTKQAGLPWDSAGADADLVDGTVRSRMIVDQLQRDVTLLASQGIMDYSLIMQLVPLSPGERAVSGVGNEMGGGQGTASAAAVRFPPAVANNALVDEDTAAALVNQIESNAIALIDDGRMSRFSPLAASICALGVPIVGGGSSGTDTVGESMADGMNVGPDYRGASRALVQLGVIDVLQFFDTTKQVESFYKQLRYAGPIAVVSADASTTSSNPVADISAIDPNRYAVRFMDLVSRVFTPQSA